MSPNEQIRALRGNIEKVFVGRAEVVDMLLVGLLAQGHILIEDLPGVGKTVLARSLAKSIDASFARIQFTPDLMPADITGSEILFEDKTTGNREFRFVKGPIFNNIVLSS